MTQQIEDDTIAENHEVFLHDFRKIKNVVLAATGLETDSAMFSGKRAVINR